MTIPKLNTIQLVSRAVKNMKNGTPTMEDYQLILRHPALTSMFLRNQSPSKSDKKV